MAERELVPYTPTSTAVRGQSQQQPHAESHSQSYLLAALGGGDDTTAHSGGAEALAGNADTTVDDAANRSEAEEAADQSTVADSQQSPSAAHPQGDTTSFAQQTSGDGYEEHSLSQPAVGPESWRMSQLPETVAESLDRTAHEQETFARHPAPARSSDPTTASSASAPTTQHDQTTSVSMDMTTAAGRVLQAQPPSAPQQAPQTDSFSSSGFLDDTRAPAEAVAGDLTRSGPTRDEPVVDLNSAASLSRSHRGPSAASALGPRSSHLEIEDGTGPTSSPAVELELLGKARSARPPAFQTGPPAPASSADSDIPPSALLDAAGKSKALSSPAEPGAPASTDEVAAGEEAVAAEGPVQSTPAVLNAPPPNPSLAAAHTVPDLSSSSGESKPRSLARKTSEPTAGESLHIATSSAMRAPPTVRLKKRREPWDDLSQSSNGTSVESQRGAARPQQALAGVPEGAVATTGAASTGKPNRLDSNVAEGDETADTAMDIDGSVPATMPHDESLPATIPHESLPEPGRGVQSAATSPSKPDEPAAQESSARRPSLEPRSAPYVQPPTSSPQGTAQPGELEDALTASEDAPTASAPGLLDKKRLSDISELRSSSEAPPTQYEVQATQKEYDVLQPSSARSQEAMIDNSDRWHASFENPENGGSGVEKSPPGSMPPPATGRALCRNPPPPSPLRSAAAHSRQEEQVTDTQRFGDAEESMQLEPHGNVDASTLVHATQHAARAPASSPDIPLAKRVRTAEPARLPPTVEAQVVPDSDDVSAPVAGPSRPRNVVSASSPKATEPHAGGSKSSKPASATAKGKRRAPVAEASVDAIDFLADVQMGETNYDDIPTARNAKGRAKPASTGAPKPPSVDKGKRRAEAPERDGDDTAPLPKRKKKLRASGSSNFEIEIQLSPARSRGSTGGSIRSSPSVPTTARKSVKSAAGSTVATPSEAKAGPAPKKRKVKAEPKRRSTTGSARTKRTATPVTDETSAGPSRRRSTTSDVSGREGTADIKPTLRQPLMGPFTRVFGLWRDDQCFYPGEIRAVTSGTFTVRFDDGNSGKLSAAELRYSRLIPGDRVRLCGADTDGAPDYRQDLVVVGVDRPEPVDRSDRQDADDDGPEVQLRAGDMVTLKDPDGTQCRLPVSSLLVTGFCGAQFHDRQPTTAELAAFEAPTSKRGESPRLTAAPKPVTIPFMEPSAKSRSMLMFSRTAFILTKADRLKDGRASIDLEEYGATMIDWPHLCKVDAVVSDPTAPPKVTFAEADFADIDEIFLLSDRHCSTPKYLAALALGIPCLSTEFVLQSIKEKIRPPWQQFVLPAGYLRSLDAVAVGSMHHAATKASLGLASLEEQYNRGGAFSGCSFLVVQKPLGRSKQDQEASHQHRYQIFALLACSSARLVHFVASAADARSASDYDHVLLLDDSLSSTLASVPTALRSHKGLVTVPWVKQCLTAGRLLPPARLSEKEVRGGAAEHD